MELVSSLFELSLFLVTLLFLIPTLFLLVECVASPRHLPPAPPPSGPFPRTTLLIPAHNEQLGIAATLESVRAAAYPELDVLVVADNCTDSTAAQARRHGAQVIERRDPALIGKGYALAFGVEYLSRVQPDILIVLDADCSVQTDALKRLAQDSFGTARPVQAVNLLRTMPGASSKTAVSNFAFFVKNRVRPAGLARLGAPCFLTGTGMALPWSVISKIDWASGHLAEDMWLSVVSARAGYAPRFCANALVYSDPAGHDHTLKTQRTRWERGHLQAMAQGIPHLLRAAYTRQSTEPLWLALELSVPPLALLVALITLLVLLSTLGLLVGLSAGPLVLALLDFALLTAAVLIAWFKFGRIGLPAQTLLAVPAYVVWKIPLYLGTLFRTRVPWTRTARDSSGRGQE